MSRPPTRAETITFLSSLGIEIPAYSKLSDKILKQRLHQALNASQRLASILPRGILSPSSFRPWDNSTSLTSVIDNGNFAEAAANYAARLQGQLNAVELYQDPFHDLRQTIMGIADFWEKKNTKSVMLQDKDQQLGILIRVVSVFAISAETPVLVVLYLPQTRDNLLAMVAWANDQRDKTASDGSFGIGVVKATSIEQKLLLFLLEQNTKYLEKDYKPNRLQSEGDFKLSFILPLGPLSFEDIGKFNNDPGCSVCGKKTISRCSGCQSEMYCSAECQKLDWSSHKATCKSIKGGTWRTIKINANPPGGMIPPGYVGAAFSFNRFDRTSNLGPRVNTDDSTPFPNVHDSKVFLVKFQVQANEAQAGSPKSMMLYDRQRSFQAHFVHEEESRDVFEEMVAEIRGPRAALQGLKMYRYAKRVGDWELSVCTDRQPADSIKW